MNRIDNIIKETVNKNINRIIRENTEDYLKSLFWQSVKNSKEYCYFNGKKDEYEDFFDGDENWAFGVKVYVYLERKPYDPDELQYYLGYGGCDVTAESADGETILNWELNDNELELLEKYYPIKIDDETLENIYSDNWTEDF